MGENSKIEWTDHTFNPWIGCRPVSDACDHCYAAAWAKRCGKDFSARTRTTAGYWRKPLAWDKAATAAEARAKVFCASLADVFDSEVPDAWRDDLFALIAMTPHLDWLLLTKRPKVARDYMPRGLAHSILALHDLAAGHASAEAIAVEWHHHITTHGHAPNIWLGVTAENQAMADLRIPTLLTTPAAKRFVSCEPLLGGMDIQAVYNTALLAEGQPYINALKGYAWDCGGPDYYDVCKIGASLDWVITGGESGPGARPMHPDWARRLRDQCAAAGVPFFFKQWGEWTPVTAAALPERFGPECDTFRTMCSNGFSGELSLESAFLHKPRDWPQCFPHGPDGDASCSGAYVQRVGKRAAGHLLDGREHREIPHG